MIKPVIVVTRRPDSDTEVSTYGLTRKPEVIVMDLGRSFDVDNLQEGDYAEVYDWVEHYRELVHRLGPSHPARLEVEAVCNELMAHYEEKELA